MAQRRMCQRPIEPLLTILSKETEEVYQISLYYSCSFGPESRDLSISGTSPHNIKNQYLDIIPNIIYRIFALFCLFTISIHQILFQFRLGYNLDILYDIPLYIPICSSLSLMSIFISTNLNVIYLFYISVPLLLPQITPPELEI